mgnify:CR=1 FL=1
MLGIRQHTKLVATETPCLNQGRGRNANLCAERDLLLIHRYYFYTRLFPLRLAYDAIITQLQKEFHLSNKRIVDVIKDNDDELKKIVQSPPTANMLSKKFPHYNWKIKTENLIQINRK